MFDPAISVPEPVPAKTHGALVLAPDPGAVRHARRLVQQVCAAAGTDAQVVDDAVLLTSEAVTNAFIHGRSEARLQVDADPTAVLVQVGDDNSRHPLLVRRDPEALDGRGMEILRLLAFRWGIRDDPYGKTVWFETRATG